MFAFSLSSFTSPMNLNNVNEDENSKGARRLSEVGEKMPKQKMK